MDLKKIAQKLERQRCPKHNKKPTAKPKGDTIELSCCCEDFKAKLTKQFQDELAKQARDDISNSLNI